MNEVPETEDVHPALARYLETRSLVHPLRQLLKDSSLWWGLSLLMLTFLANTTKDGIGRYNGSILSAKNLNNDKIAEAFWKADC